MDIFPLLSFPSVVSDGILRKVTPYELFSSSLHSEEARNIVKRFSSNHKFPMEIDLDDYRLIFKYEGEKKNILVLSACSEYEPTDHVLNFHGFSESVPADIESDEDGTSVHTYCKEEERGQRLKFLIEYMASVFNNISISIDFGVMYCDKPCRGGNCPETYKEKMEREKSKLQKLIKDTIKKLNFNYDSYKASNDVYTFEELQQLITSKSLDVSECRLTKEELKKLFDQWMELPNPGNIILGNFNDFKIEDLSSGNSIESENTRFGAAQCFYVTRADGIKARIEFWLRKFSFAII